MIRNLTIIFGSIAVGAAMGASLMGIAIARSEPVEQQTTVTDSVQSPMMTICSTVAVA